MLLRIKEFAEFCNVSIRALHLYDKMRIFQPYKIDETNGYRYYDTDQMQELNTILSFKKVGFTLHEIMNIKFLKLSHSEICKKLLEKKEDNKKQIEILHFQNEIIDDMLQGLNCNEKNQDINDAIHISKIVCLENTKLEHDFSQILWL